jgi:hypothetical protein
MAGENQPAGLISDHQFAALTYKKYKEHFDHFYRLHQFAQSSLQNHSWFTRNHYDMALQYICPRAFKSFDAIRRLCEVALCEDAAVILRCLLNLMAVTRWISLDPENRAKKYLGWYWIEQHERVERWPEKFSADAIADIQKHFETEKVQFEFITPKGKPDFAKQWYQPEARTIRDLFKGVGLEKVYDDTYKPLSGTEHSDVMAYFSMFADAEFKNGERKLAIQSDGRVPEYLRHGFVYFAQIFGIHNQTVVAANDQEFQQIVKEGTAFYLNDIKQKSKQPLV